MVNRTLYIPTLQELARQLKKKENRAISFSSCEYCEHYKKEFKVCVWDNNIYKLSNLESCPAAISL